MYLEVGSPNGVGGVLGLSGFDVRRPILSLELEILDPIPRT